MLAAKNNVTLHNLQVVENISEDSPPFSLSLSLSLSLVSFLFVFVFCFHIIVSQFFTYSIV